MSTSSQNPDHFTLTEAAQLLASKPFATRQYGPLTADPVEPPVNLPGGNPTPQPPKPSSLFCTADHRAWLLSVPCVDGGRHWVWDGQPFGEASPVYVSVDVPALHMPLTELANHPGFHSLSASHAGDDYIPAVTA